MVKLDNYVYDNLKKYGNTIISSDDLKRHGFNCNIRTLGYDRVTGIYPVKFNERTVIIEVIK